mmetsp:Transcript_5798/g.19168  ORF Transcript_5798/g.19168 Transcript_5798/m.19168 type:complete len:230 (+) Transcript_5798:328-1017(+)
MDPFSLCSSTRITAWWKYCCPPVKLSPLAMSKHPRSGAPMTCAHGVSPESVCFCFFKSARFEPLADATFFEVSSPSVLESESPLVDSMETSLARKSRQSPSSAGATSSLLASAAAATSAASFFFLAAAFSFFLKLSFFFVHALVTRIRPVRRFLGISTLPRLVLGIAAIPVPRPVSRCVLVSIAFLRPRAHPGNGKREPDDVRSRKIAVGVTRRTRVRRAPGNTPQGGR